MNSDGTFALQRIYTEHMSDIEDISVHTSQPNIFISCSCDQHIKIWDLREPKSAHTFKAHDSDINVIHWNPNEVG